MTACNNCSCQLPPSLMMMTVPRLKFNHSDYEREHDGRTVVNEQVPVFAEVDCLYLLQTLQSPVELIWLTLSTDR
jgi:hypothetical protein